MAASSHLAAAPSSAPGTGELVFFGFNPVYPPHVSVGSVRPDGEMGEIKSLWHNALQGATFVHDFCVTTRHVVLFEGSMNIRPLRMAALRHPLAYDETQKARFGVLRRRANGTIPGVEVDEDVVWCECESHEMVYHFVNAWEDEGSGEIVVTGVREDGFFHGALRARGTREWIADALNAGERTPRVHEWRLNPATGAVTSERFVFPNDVVEVPRINDRWTGVKNRFAYAGRVHEPSLARDAQPGREPEGASLTGLPVGTHLPIHQLHELVADREAKAGPIARLLVHALLEQHGCEEIAAHLGCEAHAGVANGEAQGGFGG